MPEIIILFCGGGSLGHVFPSIAIADAVRTLTSAVRFHAIASRRPEEQEAFRAAGIPVSTIDAGKFPRALSIHTFTFPFLFVLSFFQSLTILRRVRPHTVFSKGGFVTVPVCLAARCLGIRVVLHTSDAVLNLSDSLIGRFAAEIYSGFPTDAFPSPIRGKIIQTGNPVRPFILRGSRDAGVRITGFSGRRPVVLILGGSQGALSINKEVDRIFSDLVDTADIIHLTGSGKELTRSHARYFARAFVLEELPHLYALADIVVSRAGAGTLSELGVLRKPSIIIPLEGVAHDHQVRNAEVLQKLDAIELLRQADLKELLPRIRSLLTSADRRSILAENIHKALPSNGAIAIARRLVDINF